MKTIEGYNVKIFTDRIDDNAIEQLKQLLAIDVFSDKKIRIMPDVHSGSGCVIGFTGNLGDKVIPNIVGADIGCGMLVLHLRNIGEIDFHGFNEHIRGNVPSGMMVRDEEFQYPALSDEENKIYHEAERLTSELYCGHAIKNPVRIKNSIGTLGGGNHFIELDKDDEDNLYMVIHTGSRNLGTLVAKHYQKRAISHLTPGADTIEDDVRHTILSLRNAGRHNEIVETIRRMRDAVKSTAPSLPEHLCYLEDKALEDYLHDMRLCQKWAALNRKLISLLLLKFFPKAQVVNEFESVHNYISDDNLIRKGAISAAKGERCIIPLNMRDGALICVGKGNEDWNCSAPHGAGRVLSRTEAYEQITMDDFNASMSGVYSESVNEFTRDESPMVYKPADEIIANIGDTVTIESIIRPIFNFKAWK